LRQTVFALAQLAVAIDHHGLHLKGTPVGYASVALGAVISWAGLPGAGEAALVTAAVFAARHRLDIAQVMALAWLGATLGGTAGWLVGLRVGAGVAAAPGPLHHLRLSGLHAGKRFFERFGTLAVFLTPSWVAGIHRLPAAKFLPANALAALTWVALYGLVPFAVGPRLVEVFEDVGLVGTVVILAAAAVAAILGIARYRRGFG
jgi:membrane protein DedA with SNARE-associated domain